MIELKSVTYEYTRGRPAVRDMDLSVKRGDFLALLGPSGSGKTTLLYLICGLLRPASGSVSVLGLTPPSPEDLGGRVALVFQDPDDQLFAPTVYEDVAYGPANMGLPLVEVRRRASAALEKTGIWELRDRPPDSLSFGQKKLAAMAGALAMDPEVLLLDEPTAGLDPLTASRIMSFIKELAERESLTVILATHDVDMVPLFAGRLLVLKEGRAVLSGEPAEVFGDPGAVRSASLRLPRVAHLFETLPERFRLQALPLTIGQARKLIIGTSYNPVLGKTLRRGYTTGTCAAAAAMGAVAGLAGEPLAEADIRTPAGITVRLPLEVNRATERGWICGVRKDGGDDIDATHGLLILVEAVREDRPGVRLEAGPGVGRVTAPGLSVPPGEPAINPVPRRMILEAVAAYDVPGRGLRLVVSVPGGEEAARRTLNPQLGITGGISILGTTGIVEPMSVDAYKASLRLGVDTVAAGGGGRIVLTPGRRGAEAAKKQGIDGSSIAVMGNFAGYMLDECGRGGIKEVLLFGHAGKLLKLAGGIFDTHSRTADCRREILYYHVARRGAKEELLAGIEAARTAEHCLQLLEEGGLSGVLDDIAREASERATRRCGLKVGTVLTDLAGRPAGWCPAAEEIGGALGWKVPER